MTFNITEEDINRRKVLPPGWYICKIARVANNVVSKSSGANMTTFDFIVTDNPANPKCGDGTSSKNVPIKTYYVTEAGIGFALPLISALLGRSVVAGDSIEDSVFQNVQGKELKVYVKNETYQDRISNAAADFLAMNVVK